MDENQELRDQIAVLVDREQARQRWSISRWQVWGVAIALAAAIAIPLGTVYQTVQDNKRNTTAVSELADSISTTQFLSCRAARTRSRAINDLSQALADSLRILVIPTGLVSAGNIRRQLAAILARVRLIEVPLCDDLPGNPRRGGGP